MNRTLFAILLISLIPAPAWLAIETIRGLLLREGLFRHFQPVSQTILFLFFSTATILVTALLISRLSLRENVIMASLRVATVFGIILAIFAVFFAVMRGIAVFV